ncbi:MAG TPA: DUF4142 domain-containing protein [Gemmatimonadaceae bacterium]|nr:DUF4142 domain-containing protein [Gemmatimonadaceae bacterium]
MPRTSSRRTAPTSKWEDNATSTALLESANATRAALRARTGGDFDRAYIAHEVDYHQHAESLEQQLAN